MVAGHKGTEKVELSPAERSAFGELKRRLIAKPQLAHPDLTKPLIVQTDASLIAIGAVLLQCNDAGVERAVSFYSKKFSAPEQNYCTFVRESLAAVPSLEHFRVYLLGRPFRQRTYYKAP